MSAPAFRYWCPLVWDGRGGLLRDVLLTGADRYTGVEPGVPAPPDAVRLDGFAMPGLANAHSHAFHRALRGRTHSGAGSFWTWRERMYAVADRLDPDSYRALARAAYAEMALAGITAVGEFHYLHHAPGGVRYRDPNAMGAALVAAAADAGVRLTLLDTCYLTAGPDGAPLAGPQLRFGDGTVDAWRERAASFRPDGPHALVAQGIHSVRAVPPDAVRAMAADPLGVTHVHLSEQPAENESCLAAYGRTPTGLLADAGALSPATTAVHATHLTDADRALLAGTGTGVCLCPTTERDLADGIGPATAFAAGTVCLGSDSHAVVDVYEECRAVELDERLRSGVRGNLDPERLLGMATAGHGAIGWSDAGRIEPGARADLVVLDTGGVRLAGCADWTTGTDAVAATVFAASAADVRDVVADGRRIVADGRHLLVDDVPGELSRTIAGVLS